MVTFAGSVALIDSRSAAAGVDAVAARRVRLARGRSGRRFDRATSCEPIAGIPT
jgi:hypothetical protein